MYMYSVYVMVSSLVGQFHVD